MTPKSFYHRKITISFPWDLPEKVSGPAVMFDVKAASHKKKVILITNNGTHTINELWEKGVSPIMIAGYSNLQTVANWLLRNYLDTPMITLVPSGGREERYAQNRNLLEDLLCAQ